MSQDPRGSAAGAVVDALSLDLLTHALSGVRDPRDRKSCRLVSRAFARAEAASRRSARPLRREALPWVLRAFPALQALDLSACAGLDDASLAAALSAAAELGMPIRRVSLARASGVGWRGLEVLVAACPRLEAVDLSHCVAAGDREMAAVAAAAGLRELALDKCLAVTDMGLAKVAVGCPGLERLSVKWCREISDIGVELLAKKCRELRSVDISYLKVSNESLRSLSTLEKLEDLAMVSCLFIDDDGLQMLSAGNSLQSIDVSRCDHVTSQGLASLIDGQSFLQKIHAGHSLHEIETCFLSKLLTIKETLTVLRLDGLDIFASSLLALGDSCKSLVEIGLSKCHGITDDGIASLVAHCNYLRTIDLTCCHLLTDDALAAIAENCRMVECLRLESCPFVSEKGLERIATLCSHLKEIDLTDCRINDAALQHLARCSELLVLKLGLCSSISDKGLAYISSNCGKLVELDLYRCSAVTDDGLADLSRGCKKIRMLNLRYCAQITDVGLKHLSSLEELTNLELRCLVRITGIGISSIAIGCTSLVELDLKRCYSIDDTSLWAVARYSQNLRQLDISYCQVTGLGLCHLLSSLRCLQDVKMVHLSWVSIEGFEMALWVACGRLKKLKMLGGLKSVLSPELLQMLQACGCRVRWIDKPLVYKG
ncbi:F-box/LRR-repeat protein 3-like [Phragmites australis]|uniref:F-box/LRR-repeat protein 3-like n=1 Tax=Phragmites australis TaxID=29695 RepID=UPI002D781FF0|nr:F-box/LRR-repeat protein 3-like [Phragmites australis]